jgi:hypothetical protein
MNRPSKRTALEQGGQFGPVLEILVPPGLVVGVTPQTGGLVGDAVHVEGIEADNTGHVRMLAGAPTVVTG